ncbi:MAG: uroporphyrinogen decarboxylase family protein [Treponemataceae bacterium]
MNKRQRLEATVAGKAPDRVPVSAWGHFYQAEIAPATFAETMLDFFTTYDWDFMKVHSRASYHVEGWGFTYEPSKDPNKLHVCTGHPIKTTADWRTLRPLPLSTPAFQEQIDALRLIKKRLPKDVPVIMTVFSPLDVAEKLIDRNAEMLKDHIARDPESLEVALDAIADTFARFVKTLVAEGVDGLYFATKWANDVKLTAEQYGRLVRPFDLRVLAEAKSLWCNFLHLCEDRVQLGALAEYPVQVMHWDVEAGHNPTYAEGQKLCGRAVGGGVGAKTLATGSPQDVIDTARRSIALTQGKGFALGPGCSVQIGKTSAENLRALRKAVEL